MKIENEIIALIAKTLNLQAEGIAPESEIRNDLGADSLDMVGLLMAFEEKFDIEIDDKDAEKVITVQDAIDYFKKELI